jgi:hypothetical protein
MVHFLAHLVLRMMTSPAIPLVGIFPHRLRGLTPMAPPLPVLSVVSMKRPEINITRLERGWRIVLGAAAAITGVLLLASASGVLAVALLALLVLAGLDLVVTGALGHRPLYTKLGHVPRSLRRPA